jgi:acetylornithine deacetylase
MPIPFSDILTLLKNLIATPSFSKEEDKTADLIADFLHEKGIPTNRNRNNIWTCNAHFDPQKPTILLNSHHDTVKPNTTYTRNPFEATEENGKLYGLGSNDAGGCLVSLLAAFCHFYKHNHLTHNLLFAATAEEEISGKDGMELLFPLLPPVSFALVGEPTGMQMAIAEKGLLVLDGTAHGQPGHAARNEGENAIYKALTDITWIKNYRFPKISELLGEVKMSVTMIQAGSQHNIIPEICTFVIDVRTTEVYTNEEVLAIIQANLQSEVRVRSLRLRSSGISPEHPVVLAGKRLGMHTYGSPTLSDQALLPVPSLKIGPGDSARSHSADEFVFVEELRVGIDLYIRLLKEILI